MNAMLMLWACAPQDDPQETTDQLDQVPELYAFDSRFSDGSSVSYTGQTFRHLLTEDLKTHIDGLTDRLNEGWFPSKGDVSAELDFYYRFDDDTSGSLPFLTTTDLQSLQSVYADVSSGKDLTGKIAGNDPVGQHKDWSQDFVGWPGASSPEALVDHWFAELDAQAVAWSLGDVPEAPDGSLVNQVGVTEAGHDLGQLIQKFLLGAIAFSQGADDYLDDDLEDKGLLSSHTTAEEGKPYTPLEHAWDEGFGYFGASRDYVVHSDEDLDAQGDWDTVVADGAIDLTTEMAWGHSRNAAKRDAGANVDPDFTTQAWTGFVLGRQLIAGSEGALTVEELDTLAGHRDQAVQAWEKAIAATVVHYINDVLKDWMDGAPFEDQAKHWSEMKGFALSFQFNPHSPWSDADFVLLHELLGADLLSADASELLEARDLIEQTYGFDTENMGDDDGQGGW